MLHHTTLHACTALHYHFASNNALFFQNCYGKWWINLPQPMRSVAHTASHSCGHEHMFSFWHRIYCSSFECIAVSEWKTVSCHGFGTLLFNPKIIDFIPTSCTQGSLFKISHNCVLKILCHNIYSIMVLFEVVLGPGGKNSGSSLVQNLVVTLAVYWIWSGPVLKFKCTAKGFSTYRQYNILYL